mmetsp:Transcript_100378/g.287243  ORF Transcript_100378/g.287243 Transcript_100378/m.287243 type:complete len:90 (-) Transcript_100378:248-517(-)
MDRKTAFSLMKEGGRQDGSFLVRMSSRPGCYSLDMITQGLKYLPLLIEPKDGKLFLHAPVSNCVPIGDKYYSTLDELVERNKQVLRHAV